MLDRIIELARHAGGDQCLHASDRLRRAGHHRGVGEDQRQNSGRAGRAGRKPPLPRSWPSSKTRVSLWSAPSRQPAGALISGYCTGKMGKTGSAGASDLDRGHGADGGDHARLSFRPRPTCRCRPRLSRRRRRQCWPAYSAPFPSTPARRAPALVVRDRTGTRNSRVCLPQPSFWRCWRFRRRAAAPTFREAALGGVLLFVALASYRLADRQPGLSAITRTNSC